VERLPASIALLAEGMGRVASLLCDSPMRSLGMIAAVELNDAAGGAARARRIASRAYELGLFIRPLHTTIYLWPPLNATEVELRQMLEIVERAVRATA
jgi:adenosylmethionine-8-amino-7-oxononanoate aminotransferase